MDRHGRAGRQSGRRTLVRHRLGSRRHHVAAGLAACLLAGVAGYRAFQRRRAVAKLARTLARQMLAGHTTPPVLAQLADDEAETVAAVVQSPSKVAWKKIYTSPTALPDVS